MLQTVKKIRSRTKELSLFFGQNVDVHELKETCVLSYIHPNFFCRWVAWWRVWKAARLMTFKDRSSPIKVLDFGASTGELRHFLSSALQYHFIEEDHTVKSYLTKVHKLAVEEKLAVLSPGSFDFIFALDSLEHNDNIDPILDSLVSALKPDGQLIVSGPTENLLYRFGRSVARFKADYHYHTIYDIESKIQKKMKMKRLFQGPFLFPLFRIASYTKS